MLCDRDALPIDDASEIEEKSGRRIRLLGRYHLENYFLDENTIAKVFEQITSAESWLRSPTEIRARLKSIANDYVSYATALITSAQFREEFGKINLMPKGCDGKSVSELVALILACSCDERARATVLLDDTRIKTVVDNIYAKITASLVSDSDEWKRLVPAKPIINRFCSSTPLKYDGFRTAFINSSELMSTNPFAEIIEIFADFDSIALHS